MIVAVELVRADGKLSSGIVGGFNNKVKLVSRKLYRLRTQNAYETTLHHNPAALPEKKTSTNSSEQELFLDPRTPKHSKTAQENSTPNSLWLVVGDEML